MNLEGKVLGPAQARWNDYVGTAAADDAAVTADRPSLYEIAALDRDQWVLVGVELSIRKKAPRVTVFAVERKATEIHTYADVDDHAREHGQVPVTAFHLDNSTQVEDFLNEAFQGITIRMLANSVRDHVFLVTEDRDV